MAHINQYKSVGALREAIIAGSCTDQDLLDWEYREEISTWLASISETDRAEKLRKNYQKGKKEEEFYAIILETLSFTEDEIKQLWQGCFAAPFTRSQEDTVESLKLRIEELRQLFVGSISLFPSASIPLGWLPCEGQRLSKESFKSLYSRLGDTWSDAESDQFVLPNLNAQHVNTHLKYCVFSGVLERIPKDKKALVDSVRLKDRIFQVKGVSFVMKPVEGGRFEMGSEDNDAKIHEVSLSDYYIGQYPVTQLLWEAVMGDSDNPSSCKGDRLPVESVSWNDCQKFLQKLNALTGGGFRLPTEAEWEFAARGGVKSRGSIYSGSTILKEVGWNRNNSDNKVHLVGEKLPNELGLFDMSGNVWEWCQDWYGVDYYVASSYKDPTGPTIGSNRVYRGGSWNDPDSHCLVSYRYYYPPGYSDNDLGFRLVFTSESKNKCM